MREAMVMCIPDLELSRRFYHNVVRSNTALRHSVRLMYDAMLGDVASDAHDA